MEPTSLVHGSTNTYKEQSQVKLKDIFQKDPIAKSKPFASHSENDLISSIQKVLDGAHFNTLPFKLESSKDDLGKGLLKFEHESKHYKITHDGKVYEGSKLIDEFAPSGDIHHHYSLALHNIAKKLQSTK